MESDAKKENRTECPILPEGIGRFNERLTKLIGDESVRAFGRKVGISDTTIRKYLTGETEPTLSRFVAIAVACDVSVEWLAIGEEPKAHKEDFWWFDDDKPAKASPTISKAQYKARQTRSEITYQDKSENTYIEAYGEFIVGSRSNRREPVSHKWLERRGFSANHLKIVVAQGDPMSPTIADDDSLVVNTNSTKLIDGKIFVLDLGGGPCARRIQQLWTGEIELIPDNKEYSKQVIPAAELERLQVIGQVVRIGKDIN